MSREHWIEPVLRAWASWVRDNARWQGWGSGVDRIEASDGPPPPREPGTHSDPVLAELQAMLHDRQGAHAKLHSYILDLPTAERRVTVARYCGIPRPVRSAVLNANFVVPHGTVPTVCLLDYVWSGPLRLRTVADVTGLSEDACSDALKRARKWLIASLALAKRARELKRAA